MRHVTLDSTETRIDKINKVFDPRPSGHDAALHSHPMGDKLNNWLSSLGNNEDEIADND